VCVGSSCEHDEACPSTYGHAGPPHRQPKSVFIDIEHFGKIYPTGAVSGWLTCRLNLTTAPHRRAFSNVQIFVQRREVY
jgi:hypothetical protein